MKMPFTVRFDHGIRNAAVATVALLALAVVDAPAADYTWTQAAGGSQNWTTGSNWLSGSAPSPVSGDTVDFSTVDILANTTLTLGASRTAAIWKFGDLTGGQTWTVSGNTLTLAGSGANLNVGTATTISSILAVANGTTATATGSGALMLDNASFVIGGTSGSQTQTMDLSDLGGSFAYSNSSGAFQISGKSTGTSGASTGNLSLADTSTITASSFGVGNSGGNANNASTSLNFGTVNLGTTATINANTITLGNNKAQGTVQYASGSGIENPSLTIRGGNGGSNRVTAIIIGVSGANQYSTTSTWDLTSNVSGASTLDAMIDTLTIGESNRANNASDSSASVTGSFLMGGGTLDATTIVLGKTNTTNQSLTTAGTFTTGAGGTVKVGTLTIGDKNSSDSPNVTGTFNLNGGANLHAITIQKGAGTATRNFNWNDGTIHNLAGTDLTINTGVTWTLAATGTRKFDIDNGRTGTVNASLAGAGGLIKAGEGKLTLAATNTYAGDTTIEAGTLEVSGSLASDNIYVQTGLLLVSGTVGGTSLVVQSGGILGGDGVINAGALVFQSGAKLQFNPSNTLTYNGSWDVNFTDFSVASLVGLDNTVALGTYTLIDDGANDRFDLSSGVSNVGSGNAYDLGGGKYAWFEEGSLNLVVSTIPEPATLGLIGVVGVAMLLRRKLRG